MKQRLLLVVLICSFNNELKNNAVQLNVSPLKSGFYFVKATNGISQTVQKLIIN